MSSKLKNILFLYLTLFSALLLLLVGAGLIITPILLGVFVSPYYYYLLIISIILLPLPYIGIGAVFSHLHS